MLYLFVQYKVLMKGVSLGSVERRWDSRKRRRRGRIGVIGEAQLAPGSDFHCILTTLTKHNPQVPDSMPTSLLAW